MLINIFRVLVKKLNEETFILLKCVKLCYSYFFLKLSYDIIIILFILISEPMLYVLIKKKKKKQCLMCLYLSSIYNNGTSN